MSSPSAVDTPKRKLAIRSSTKIAVGFVLLAAAVYFGRNLWGAYNVDHLVFDEIQPGKVNLVAVNPGAGFRVIVANQAAQLVEGSTGAFDAPDSEGTTDSDDTSGDGGKKRIPIKELLLSLQGNEAALSKFVMTMNDLRESNLPPERIIWKAEDIQKAFKGDVALSKKLESDLNVKLDGTPLDHLSRSALFNGIVIDSPVTVTVPVGNQTRQLTARILEPFKAKLMRQVERQVERKFDVSNEMLAGYYKDEVAKLLADPKQTENVRHSLEDQIRESRLQAYAAAPEKVLRNAKVVVNDGLIQRASYDKIVTQNGKPLFNLTIDLSEEGQKRLWKYSRERPGFQLLLIVDGIAIAAPKMNGELSRDEVTITQLPDEGLVKDAVDQMNHNTQGDR